MNRLNDVIIEDSLDGVGTHDYEAYLIHAICLGGSCSFKFNGRQFDLLPGDLMIVRKGRLLDDLRPSADFSVRTLYVTASFVELCATQTNYCIRGQLSLFLNPVMHLDEGQRFVCERDFRWISYRHNREVAYYADALCVTPKYLSEVSKKVSGYPANYWINRYTTLDISRLLRDRNLTFVQISDMFHFSSPAYFSRYVQRTLGLTPTQYRE